MFNKKAQFYFLAVIVLASIFVGFVTVSNKSAYVGSPKLSQDASSINTEIKYLLDYFSRGNVSDSVINQTLSNFSYSYIDEIGTDNDVFFIFGKSSLTLTANKLPTTNLAVNTGSGEVNVSENGIFQKEYSFSGTNNASLILDGTAYNFTFYPGENVYYLIRSNENGQFFVITG